MHLLLSLTLGMLLIKEDEKENEQRRIKDNYEERKNYSCR